MVALGKASNAFLAWAASHGIETPLNLAEREDGRYVVCSEDIHAGQDLLSCPISACISADSLEGKSLDEDIVLDRVMVAFESFYSRSFIRMLLFTEAN